VRALVSLRTVLGNAGAELLDAQLSVPEVHARLDDDSLDAELTSLLSALETRPALAA
jgi:hypothetical protein